VDWHWAKERGYVRSVGSTDIEVKTTTVYARFTLESLDFYYCFEAKPINGANGDSCSTYEQKAPGRHHWKKAKNQDQEHTSLQMLYIVLFLTGEIILDTKKESKRLTV